MKLVDVHRLNVKTWDMQETNAIHVWEYKARERHFKRHETLMRYGFNGKVDLILYINI